MKKKLSKKSIKQRETYLEKYGREGYVAAGRKGALKRWANHKKVAK